MPNITFFMWRSSWATFHTALQAAARIGGGNHMIAPQTDRGKEIKLVYCELFVKFQTNWAVAVQRLTKLQSKLMCCLGKYPNVKAQGKSSYF